MLQDGVTRALEAGNEQLLRDSGPKLYFSLKSLMSKSPALMPDDFISFKFVPQASPVESNGGCMFTCSVLLSIMLLLKHCKMQIVSSYQKHKSTSTARLVLRRFHV